jgi:hypothetical protein
MLVRHNSDDQQDESPFCSEHFENGLFAYRNVAVETEWADSHTPIILVYQDLARPINSVGLYECDAVNLGGSSRYLLIFSIGQSAICGIVARTRTLWPNPMLLGHSETVLSNETHLSETCTLGSSPL